MRTFFFCLGVLLIGTAKGNDDGPKATDGQNEVTLVCPDGIWVLEGDKVGDATMTVKYENDASREYQCQKGPEPDKDVEYLKGKIYVRLRLCENCIDLEWSALTGIIMGNIVATILIGVAVYSISTQSKGPSFSSNKASQESDRRNLIPNDSTYQPLTNSGRDAYEVLHTRRR